MNNNLIETIESIESLPAWPKNILEWLDLATSAMRESLKCELSAHNTPDLMQIAYVLSGAGLNVYRNSIQLHQNCLFMLISLEHLRDRFLLIIGDSKEDMVLFGFEGEWFKQGNSCIQACRPNRRNAEYLRLQFPYTAPTPKLSDSGVSIGLGDRLGLASYGQLSLLSQYQSQGHSIYPILAQQSMQELVYMRRSYYDIIDEASWDVFAHDYKGPWGVDAHNLKTSAEVYNAITQGCTMITADVSNKIQNEYQRWDDAILKRAYDTLSPSYVRYLEHRYLDTVHKIPLHSQARDSSNDSDDSNSFDANDSKDAIDVTELEFTYTRRALLNMALIYYEALKQTYEIHDTIREYERLHEIQIDFELSMQKSTRALTPQAHYFIAGELQKMKIHYDAFSPHFCGKFLKGLDYIGDLKEFERQLAEHGAIARHFGYKLSVHSASDKFSVLSMLSRVLQKDVHIKTSGTHWLVALKTIAQVNPKLFRLLHEIAYQVYAEASEHYHMNPDFSKKITISKIKNDSLATVLDNPCDRQVMHIAYGEIFKQDALSKAIMDTLQTHLTRYWEQLHLHTDLHLRELFL